MLKGLGQRFHQFARLPYKVYIKNELLVQGTLSLKAREIRIVYVIFAGVILVRSSLLGQDDCLFSYKLLYEFTMLDC